MLIVDRYPVASNVLGVPLAFQPANIHPDQIIILERRLLQPRISIIEPQEKASLVHPRIVVGENYRPDRTQVQNKVWEIGRASCREREKIWEGEGGSKKKKQEAQGEKVVEDI